MKHTAKPEQDVLRVTLISNAGLLLEYNGITLMLDGIYGREGHPFSNLSADTWQRMLQGLAPFEQIDYLLFSHAHPDHFSPAMTCEFLQHRRVKGVFLPSGMGEAAGALLDVLQSRRIPCVTLSEQTDHAYYRIEPEITVHAFSTRHLDKKFWNIPHFCYLITFGRKQVLFTADVDYTSETFAALGDTPLRAVFVNPLFFSALEKGSYFHGTLHTQSICIYHVPFSQDDSMRMRPPLARNLVEWPLDRQETFVLCDAFQQIEL